MLHHVLSKLPTHNEGSYPVTRSKPGVWRSWDGNEIDDDDHNDDVDDDVDDDDDDGSDQDDGSGDENNMMAT